MAIVVSRVLSIPDAEVDVHFARSGGPGGQHVNKTETKAELRWNVRESAVLNDTQRRRLLKRLANRVNSAGELIVTSQESRSQSTNLADAKTKLARLVANGLRRQKRRVPTKRTRGSQERRLKKKRIQSERKRDRNWRRD